MKTDVGDRWRVFLDEEARIRDYHAYVRLSRRTDALVADAMVAERLLPVRLAIVGSATPDFLLPALKTALLARGVKPELHVAPYGQVTSSLLDPDSALARFSPQITLVSTPTLHLPGPPALTASRAEVAAAIDAVCRALLEPCESFHARTGSEIVLSNFAPLPWRSAGSLGPRLPGDPTSFIRRVNIALEDRAPHYVHIDDIAAEAERVGTATWHDDRLWHLAKQAVALDAVPAYARHLAGLVSAILGRGRKCLVVDLDNTLWGGVVGDDGVEGIRMSEGDAEGEAFLAFQAYLCELKERGILLAVSSKNDEAVARSAFTDHPDVRLRLQDFVAFKANWAPKSENLRAIAAELDLPLDALVFVDDNPAERAEVSRALPEVAVPEMPDDAASFIRTLDAARYFESVRLTDEDRSRTAAYVGRRQVREALAGTTDVGAYLASLDMRAIVRPFEAIAFERIAQLVNKTNQFNLTTPRVVQADIERMAADPMLVTRTIRLRDRFADHGLISVCIARREGAALVIDAWLMSCRVLGRGVERLMFNELLAVAQAEGRSSLVGLYRPTARTGLVKEHYAGLGFRRVRSDGHIEEWRLETRGARPF